MIDIKNNTESSLYIIDDAQQLSEKVIEGVKRQARPNSKILIAKTISKIVKQDTILLTNKEAVELMYTNFLKRKEEILPIVHECDANVGINFLDQSIERRLEAAKKAVTPWQFNYILRGGWQNVKELYQSICLHNNCDLLTASIAVFQILKLDHSVDFDWICSELRSFDDSLIWDKEDLHYLVGRMIVLSEDDVRIVHMESAKIIIALFFKNSEKYKKQILLNLIEKSFIEKRFSPLGVVWLSNGMNSYDMFFDAREYFITEKMVVSTLHAIGNIDDYELRRDITFFMEKVFDLKCERNGRYYFCEHEKVLLDWIQNSDSKTAYAYSILMNTLINTDTKQHRNFVQEINWACLQESMVGESKPNLFSWGELYNRLIYSLSNEERLSIGKMLENAIDKFSRIASASATQEAPKGKAHKERTR